MVAPLALGLFAGAAAIGGMYHVGQAYENRRYWDSYFKNTRRSPRYRYRSGYSNLGYYYAATSAAAYGASFYSPATTYGYRYYEPDYMYG